MTGDGQARRDLEEPQNWFVVNSFPEFAPFSSSSASPTKDAVDPARVSDPPAVVLINPENWSGCAFLPVPVTFGDRPKKEPVSFGLPDKAQPEIGTVKRVDPEAGSK